MRSILLSIAISLAISLPAAAQQLKLVFSEGRVSLEATSVPVRTILSEWARLGGTQIIGGERITGAPLTLKLDAVPESQALEIVLRSVAGYMAAPRAAAGAAGASTYDRILVMATSAAPAPAPRPTPTAGGAAPANQRFTPAFRQPSRPASDEQEEPDDEEDPNPPEPPVFTFPQPGANGGQPGFFQPPPGVNGQPVITINPNTGAPQSITITPAPNPGGTAPTIGSPTPGMFVAPPAPTPQPGPMVRPPGGV